VSDSQGLVHFDRVPAGRIGAHLDEGPQTRGDVVVGKETSIDARRSPGLAVSAVVRDAHGRAVPGARVDVFGSRDGAALRTSAPADENGRIALEDVSSRAWIAARADGSCDSDLVWLGLPQYAVAGRADFVLDLPGDAVAFEGLVLDEQGALLAGVHVALTSQHAEEALWHADGSAAFEPPARSASTDASGRFRVDGLRASPYAVRIELPGAATLDTHIEPVNGAFQPLTVRLARSAAVAGIARFGDGSPAPSVRFEACALAGGLPIVAVSDAHGAFRIEGLTTGRCVLQARAGGIGPVTRIELDVNASEPVEWNPTVAHQETIEGHAIGEDGRLVKTWLVFAVPETVADDDAAGALTRWSRSYVPADPDAMFLQCWIDLQGHFVVPCRSGSTHRIELRPRSAWQGVVQAVATGVPAGARQVELRVKPRLGGFQGRFVDARGKPLPMALVVAVPHDITAETRAPVDAATGRFDIQLMPGRYDLLAWPTRGPPWYAGRFEIPANAKVDLGDRVVADPGELVVTTEGFVADAMDLRSDRGLRLEMQPVSSSAWSARGLQPGSYRVALARPDGTRVEREIEVRAAETAHALITAQ
jgi:hypothetical protein